MPPWGLRWMRLFLNPFADDDFSYIDESDRRKYIFERLEGSKLSECLWVVIVAGVGFFTDAYSIFAINMVVPMLGIIYYRDEGNNSGKMPHNHQIALSVVTLGGSMAGQVAFGLGADLYGRRKMYGLELIITIFATLGVVMSSNGTEGSMSVIVWLLVWRFALGIGIGADYPLSAVLTAEFAPRKLRGKMMTAVFMCQPLGQLAATLVTLIAVATHKNSIPLHATAKNCDRECIKTMDSIWRWVIGVGVIPALLALWFRLTIIESARYTADVGRDSKKAASELNRYLPTEPDSAAASVTSGRPLNQPRLRKPLVNWNARSTSFDSQGQQPHIPLDVHIEDQITASESENKPPPVPSWEDFKDYFWTKGNLRTLITTSLCWFAVDLPFYGLGMNSPDIITVIWHGIGTQTDIIYPMMIDNVWQSLVVVSIGAIAGCLITFVAIDMLGRRNIQLIGFFFLFILFIIIGGSFNHLYKTGGSAATIVLYILCQIFFNFGPNTVTYIISAELFPTRYRALSHGISAAFGKFGSVIAQLYLAYINYGHDIKGHDIDYKKPEEWLPYSLLVFSGFMLVGFFLTYFWLPKSEYDSDGVVKSLEQWEVGRPENGFSKTRVAKVIEKWWRWASKSWDRVVGLIDKDEGERRAEAREQRRLGREMREMRGGDGVVNGDVAGDGNRNSNGNEVNGWVGVPLGAGTTRGFQANLDDDSRGMLHKKEDENSGP